MNNNPVYSFDFWLFLAGLGIFLFGMYHLEKGIQGIAGKSFRSFLKKFTNRPWKGLFSGAFASAILQSSTLVTLLTAAFLGAGLLNLQNALGIVFGANIGTTATAWIVAFLGFELDISDLSYPFLGIGILTYLFMNQRPILKSLGSFCMGFGMLFLGIDFMKEAVVQLTNSLDFSTLANVHIIVFVGIGIVVTALIQSSSAMMVIVLSALFAGILDIYQACAISIGANIGTTVSLILASFQGPADKKRLALGHVIFNVVGGILALVFLNQIVYLLKENIGLRSPVLILAGFNSFMNIAGAAIFMGFIPMLSTVLSKWYTTDSLKRQTIYISKINTDVIEVALSALDKEIQHVFSETRTFILQILRIDSNGDKNKESRTGIWNKTKDHLQNYHQLKMIEDEVTGFYKKLQSKNLSHLESGLLAAQMIRLRSLGYAAKNIKDVIANVEEITESEDETATQVFTKIQLFVFNMTNQFMKYLNDNNGNAPQINWEKEIDEFYHTTIDFIYDQISMDKNTGVQVSTLTHVVKKTVSCLEELVNATVDERKIHKDVTDIYTE